jgi:hypothetical protein
MLFAFEVRTTTCGGVLMHNSLPKSEESIMDCIRWKVCSRLMAG